MLTQPKNCSNKGNRTGAYFFVVHLCVEIVCFMVLFRYYNLAIAGVIALAFDMFAFVPQGLFGEFMDRHRKFPMGVLGVVFMGLGAYITSLSELAGHSIDIYRAIDHGEIIIFIGIMIMAVGNAILHEQGALETVAKGNGKIFPAALFVAGGSFGVVIGQTMGKFDVSFLWLGIPLAVILLMLFLSGGLKDGMTYPEYNCIRAGKKDARAKDFPWGLIIAVAFSVTAVRSFMSYAIPISWKKEIWQDFLLFFVMGIGKALGGYLTDRFGARRVGVFSTLLAIPFLVFGAEHMIISVIGVCFFSMTMCITFEMVLSALPKNPGMAFGVTTIALFTGLVPVFFVRPTAMVNIILVVTLSIACAAMLNHFCKNEAR